MTARLRWPHVSTHFRWSAGSLLVVGVEVLRFESLRHSLLRFCLLGFALAVQLDWSYRCPRCRRPYGSFVQYRGQAVHGECLTTAELEEIMGAPVPRWSQP